MPTPVLRADCQNDLGEGPTWDADGSRLLWVDFDQGLVWRYDPNTNVATAQKVASEVMVAIPTNRGNLVLATGNEVALYNASAGGIICRQAVKEDRPANRLNDGKCDSKGRLWIGTMDRQFAPHSGALYRVDGDLQYTKMDEPFTIPNGIAWNRQNNRMFVVDSKLQQVFAYDFNEGAGTISNKKVLIDTAAVNGLPDGMAMDENDHLWIAFWEGGCLVQYDSRTGELLQRIETPIAVPTSCCFGGADLATLFITSSRKYDKPQNLAPGSKAGGLFSFQPGVKGTPTNRFSEDGNLP